MADQLTLNFEAGLAHRFDSARALIQSNVLNKGVQQKYIAADMGYSPSKLSRKLAQNDGDSSRFTLDDLETYLLVTEDRDPIYYLVEKYLVGASRDEEIKALKAKLAELEGQG